MAGTDYLAYGFAILVAAAGVFGFVNAGKPV